MSLSLSLAALTPVATTAGSVEVELRLRNDSAEALSLPGPDDTSGALSIEVRDVLGAPIRALSGLTHQEMMVGGRPDARPALALLAPGAEWRWTLDLSSYHYPLPAGELSLVARYDYPEAGVSLRSGAAAVTVHDLPLVAVRAVRDNSLLDMLTLVSTGVQGGERVSFLRQHNHDRPLAAWYAQPVAERGAEVVVVAAHAFMRFDTFDHCYDRTVVWQRGVELAAQRLRWGRPLAEAARCSVSPGESLVAAGERDDGSVDVILATGAGIRCVTLRDGAFEARFAHPLAGLLAATVAPGGVLALDHQAGTLGLTRLAPDGSLVDEQALYVTRLAPVYAEFDGCRRVARALFRDGPNGRLVEMVATGPDFEGAEARRAEVGVRGDVTELHFDRDDAGRFHLLATVGRGLYYYRDDAGPARIAEGQDAFLPIAVARRGAYLGCYVEGLGYRFLRYSHRPNGTGVVSFDAPAHEE